jgi:uncharacterized protein (DUF697 family)
MSDEIDEIRSQVEVAKKEYEELGGPTSFKSGEWLGPLIQKSFRNYWERANVEYFENKYETKDKEKIAKKLIIVAARNASLLGGISGATISADEFVGFFTVGEGGVGIPANFAIAFAAIITEAVGLIRLQLQLVANLGKLYGAPLDPDDPEDILVILAFALGGGAADLAGKAGMKIGGKLAGHAAEAVFKKELSAVLKRISAKLGLKILQRTIVKYAVPVASVGIGLGWNYFATKTVGKLAIKHFTTRVEDLIKTNQAI